MLTPAPDSNILRKMEYISDQEGILRRYNREREGWDEHLNKCGDFIFRILQNHQYRHVVVLGSGWLLDFPLEKIYKIVEKITLLDINFPDPVKRKVKDFINVECIPTDITGGAIQMIYDGIKSAGQKFILPGEIQTPHIIPEEGRIIISLNILNQLDILLVDYMRKKLRTKEEQIRNFRKSIQEAHIRLLMEHPFIMVTDFREILINTHGKVQEERELIYTEFPSGSITEEWEWKFDTCQLYNSNSDTLMKVRAVYSDGPGK
jgi:hypothetical protein